MPKSRALKDEMMVKPKDMPMQKKQMMTKPKQMPMMDKQGFPSVPKEQRFADDLGYMTRVKSRRVRGK